MANTYTQLYIQIVFAVKYRQHLIAPARNDELQKYMTGTVTGLGSKLISINNMPDHFHMLVGLNPDMSVSALAGKVKSASSRFINSSGWVYGRFEWQEGFGGFSYSRSSLPSVVRYIENQQRHHASRTFAQEYRALLEAFDISFDGRFVLREPVDLADQG